MGLSRPPVVGWVVYGTITLMSVLVVYDGWQQLRFRDVVGVIVGPVLAMFLSHLFAATLAKQVELGRAVTGTERARIAWSESPFLLLAVPPVVFVGILTLPLGKGMQDDQRCAAKGVTLAAVEPLLSLLSTHLSFTEIAQELFLSAAPSSWRRTRSTGSQEPLRGARRSPVAGLGLLEG